MENITTNEKGEVVKTISVAEYVEPILQKIDEEKQIIEQSIASNKSFVESHLQKIDELKAELSILTKTNE
jgi:hypothetical protein